MKSRELRSFPPGAKVRLVDEPDVFLRVAWSYGQGTVFVRQRFDLKVVTSEVIKDQWIGPFAIDGSLRATEASEVFND